MSFVKNQSLKKSLSVKKSLSWIIFGVFVAIAMFSHNGEPLFISESPYAAGKIITWIVFFGFVAYSYYCSMRENIFRTIKTIWPLHWARQIGFDLYLGLLISMSIIYLNEGSFLVLALWFVPIILFANLATLLYFAMNFETIVSHFL